MAKGKEEKGGCVPDKTKPEMPLKELVEFYQHARD